MPYSLENFDDEFAHLSNHCIQTKSTTYGNYEPTNEMFYAEFDSVLGENILSSTLLPQVYSY